MAKHLGKNLRSIRLLKGMKQDTFAKKMGIAQQNVSRMEKKAKLSQKKLEDAAKILGVTVETIKKFNEKAVINNNLALGEDNQVNHFNPVQDIIEYFKGELQKKDQEILALRTALEASKKDDNSELKMKTSDKSENSKLTAIK